MDRKEIEALIATFDAHRKNAVSPTAIVVVCAHRPSYTRGMINRKAALKPVEEHRAKRPDEAGTSRRKAA